jgi:MOSC domain-containing protein YiiM
LNDGRRVDFLEPAILAEIDINAEISPIFQLISPREGLLQPCSAADFFTIAERCMALAHVDSIYIGSQKKVPMSRVDEATARAGLGLEGDRYYRPEGNEPDREITLIEAESIEELNRKGVAFEIAESRRNVVTRGVSLNDLVGRQFHVGAVRLEGIRLCDPCGHLEKLTRPGVRQGLDNRGGLRARIVEGGPIRVGDPVIIS